MADRVRAFDWANTPVGPMENWPISLRTAVATMLECQIPMYIAWGEEFIQFYNDACRPMLGTTKHPQALGTGAQASWPEIWETIGPIWHEVLKGKTIGLDDFKLTIERHGYPEDVYFNISYSPLRDDSANVAGMLATYTRNDRSRAHGAAKVNNIQATGNWDRSRAHGAAPDGSARTAAVNFHADAGCHCDSSRQRNAV
ncbi:hypothetical protein LP414_18420 [Polaromonas sp. P1(28)-13]|nr:hypothetical protein LP414_18420 [Polaromonas sp. P1(28)-13]